MIVPIVSDKLTSASSTPFSSVEDNKTPSTPAGGCLLRPVWLFALFDADVLAFWNPQKMLTFYHTLGQTFTLKPRPQVAVLIWKRGFFFPPVCPTIHTYPVKTVTENASFPNVSQSGDFCKRHQTIVSVWTEENGGFRIRWCHTSCSACPGSTQSVFPSFLRVRVDGRKRFKYTVRADAYFSKTKK